jgi:hypothetical protein
VCCMARAWMPWSLGQGSHVQGQPLQQQLQLPFLVLSSSKGRAGILCLAPSTWAPLEQQHLHCSLHSLGHPFLAALHLELQTDCRRRQRWRQEQQGAVHLASRSSWEVAEGPRVGGQEVAQVANYQ